MKRKVRRKNEFLKLKKEDQKLLLGYMEQGKGVRSWIDFIEQDYKKRNLPAINAEKLFREVEMMAMMKDKTIYS